MRKLVLILLCALGLSAFAAEPPETVMGVARPQKGKEADLLQALRDDHDLMDRLGLITGPYLLYRGDDEGGGTVFIASFTWKSGDIPDHAPPEIRKSWARIMSLVAKQQSGCPGFEFWAVEAVPATGSAAPQTP